MILELFSSVSPIGGSYPSPMYPTIDSLKADWPSGPYVRYVWNDDKLTSVTIVSRNPGRDDGEPMLFGDFP